MHLCLFEDRQVNHFSPITRTRGVYQIRTGAFSNLIRIWEAFDRPALSLHARSKLAGLIQSQTGLPVNQLPEDEGVLFVNGRIVSITPYLVEILKGYTQDKSTGRLFLVEDTLIAAWVPQPKAVTLTDLVDRFSFGDFQVETVETDQAVLIDRLSQIIDQLEPCLRQDLNLLFSRTDASYPLDFHESVVAVNPENIYIAPGAFVHPGAILNAVEGPIFIDSEAQIMESAIVKGPAYIGKQSVVKPRADVGMSVLGPVCKAGGEVKESIFQSYSNKAHEGFLGHAYMGSWCNIGAGTNASNLKNDYSETALFNEALGLYEKTGRQFLGVIMADHSKIGISSMINTATVIGTCCNLFGTGFMPRHIPSFTWGSPDSGFEPYRLDKAFQAMKRVMARRNRILSEVTQRQLEMIYHETHDKATV